MECSKCPISTPGLVSFDGQQTYDCPFDIPDPCSLTLATINLVQLLIKKGILDEDAAIVEKAIAGEGRLFVLTPSEAHMVGEYRWNLQVARDKWERGQDQGGE